MSIIYDNKQQINNPLHGVTLEQILTRLVEKYGWLKLSEKIAINCFKNEPSIKSSLKFLRKTPWAREKVEQLYLNAQTPKTQQFSTQKKNNSNKSSNTHKQGLINAQVWGSSSTAQIK